jgi:hypothetical protein
MAETNFVIFEREGKVPVLAGCTGCQRKFFTPVTLMSNHIGAEQYLWDKFIGHNCRPEPEKRGARK